MKLAIFDCDGTLVDGQAPICEAMEEAFKAFSIPPPSPSTIRRSVGLSLPQAIRQLLPDSSTEQQYAMVDVFKKSFRSARAEGRISQPLFPGIADTLNMLCADGWTLAVATGMSDRGLKHCLAINGVADLFETLQTADHHPSKPHPSMLQEALFQTGAQAQDAVMIGDTAYDMKMAVAANVRAIGVDWGYHLPEELTTTGAEVVVETPKQLLEYLLK